MSAHGYETVPLGDLVEAVFDVARDYSTDSKEVSEMATAAVVSILQQDGIRIPRDLLSGQARAGPDPFEEPV